MGSGHEQAPPAADADDSFSAEHVDLSPASVALLGRARVALAPSERDLRILLTAVRVAVEEQSGASYEGSTALDVGTADKSSVG